MMRCDGGCTFWRCGREIHHPGPCYPEEGFRLWAFQVMEEARDEDEAQAVLAGLAEQDGYMGGRVLPPGPGKPWRVQAFMEDDPSVPEHLLPEGVRRVLIPPGQVRSLGLQVA